MPLRFWLYLMIKVILIVMFTALALLMLPASSHWIFSALFSRFWLIFDVLLVCMLLLDRVIEWKIKKIDSEAGTEANKAMLKRYKVIDWIWFGFICLFLVCSAIPWVRSWFP